MEKAIADNAKESNGNKKIETTKSWLTTYLMPTIWQI
jgi:hypothetical protein